LLFLKEVLVNVSSMRPITQFIVHFFCPSKRNEPKKRRPEMTTSTHPYARYTSHIGATGWVEVRAISGLPTRR
jgi:hypothetical protein